MFYVSAVQAHDPSAYGGLFRSRNGGETWLNADVGLFLSGAIAVAVDPADSNHLLLGTDSGLLASGNGGRSWEPQAPGMVSGAVFAVVFFPDGKTALCSSPGGIFRFDAGAWQRAAAPIEAAPGRAIALGATPGRVYLIGRRDLYRSDDSGVNWAKVDYDLPPPSEFSLLAVSTQPDEVLYAIVDGRAMASRDEGRTWHPRLAGLPDVPLEALTIDPAATRRLWIAGADRLYRSDDGGVNWHGVGRSLPEPGTSVRGIAADPSAKKIVTTTHRGMYRSDDGGENWALGQDNLPVHLEARPLVRDPTQPDTLYAGYSLMPYGQIWRSALEGGNLLSRVDLTSLAGAAALLTLVVLSGITAARWLFNQHSSQSEPVRGHIK